MTTTQMDHSPKASEGSGVVQDRQRWSRMLTGTARAAQIILGCVFICSGVIKCRHAHDFLAAVYSYELLSPKLGILVAIALPYLEIAVGTCLVGGVLLHGAGLTGVLLGTLFVFVQSVAIHRNLNIDCGCFGPVLGELREKVGLASLSRAMVLLTACLLTYSHTLLGPPSRQQ